MKSPLVSACRWFHGEHLDLFNEDVLRTQNDEDSVKAYTSICDKLFEDGRMNTGRILSLFTFSALLDEAKPDMNMTRLLGQQIESRRTCWPYLGLELTERKMCTLL